MAGYTSQRLQESIGRIMALWSARSRKEIPAAAGTSSLALADSLPMYLEHLAKALSENRRMDLRSVEIHDAKAVRIGKLHGVDRAGNSTYILTEVIFEYHILREVIFQVLEEEKPLTIEDRDVILDSIEQAVNDAAVQFTASHADIQEKFISTLTHDLITPITAGKTSAQLLLRRPERGEQSDTLLRRILSSFNRLDSMIHDLLDASRLRAGEELTMQLIDCDLGSILDEVIEEYTLIDGSRFRIQMKQPIQGKFSPNGIRRALENLIGNAVKYSTPATPITVTLERNDSAVRIVVHNEGNPIPENEQSVLFEQYRRAKSASESKKTGWGLGLTLVRGVVAAHHGTIRLESTMEKGTCFILEIPSEIAKPRSLVIGSKRSQ